MKNLRDTYRRCKKKHDAAIKSGASASSTPNWEFWSILTWLDDFAKRRQTISNVVITVEDQLTSSQIQEDSEEIAESVLADSPSSQSTNLSSTSEIVRCKKRKAEDMSPYQTKLIGYLETLHKKQVKEPESQDEYNFFGKSVAEQIRKLPTPYARAKAKKEIQDVLFKLEFPEN
ncbi:uncharacterized protein LOC124440653 [Xenia sp. Carnegie-2017]|uniref:uncharacterized protein LOC124440653 n=1 Tax=Xenia sp. Carnegie-2017 TaxID=2897299 RepID=UPI001F037D2F|nr:uncharacterized protein LOC124440653 [Xenia sp. Carnegie-2017]